MCVLFSLACVVASVQTFPSSRHIMSHPYATYVQLILASWKPEMLHVKIQTYPLFENWPLLQISQLDPSLYTDIYIICSIYMEAK